MAKPSACGLGAAIVALVACQSEPLDPEACPDVGVAREPLTPKCFPHPLEPISDPASPDHGRVECEIVSVALAGPDGCRCDEPGFLPATPEQVELARSSLRFTGSCESPCCDEYCFCEFLQLSGDALAACQSRPSTGTYAGEPSGWCYVDPALGFGTDEDVAKCPPFQRRDIRFFPADDPLYNIDAIVACVGAP